MDSSYTNSAEQQLVIRKQLTNKIINSHLIEQLHTIALPPAKLHFLKLGKCKVSAEHQQSECVTIQWMRSSEQVLKIQPT